MLGCCCKSSRRIGPPRALGGYTSESATISYLLSDKEITKQATLQNRVAIDFLLLLNHHNCHEFEGLCCMDLNTRKEDVCATLQHMRDLIGNIKQESEDWPKNLFSRWGLSGWLSSLSRTILLGCFCCLHCYSCIHSFEKMLFVPPNLISQNHCP